MKKFIDIFSPTSKTRILDVGGTPYNWLMIKSKMKITLLNLDLPGRKESLPPNFTLVKGNGTNLQYDDSEYDICYFNSVIEHLGNYENQMKFARELCRVGKRVWVQTPARSFFIEPHLITPFIHYLPKEFQRLLIRNFTVWGLITRPTRKEIDNFLLEVRLLSYRESSNSFPIVKYIVKDF